MQHQDYPELQKERTRSNCKCGGPCFYCERPLHGRHDHDHFPVPARNGGQHTVPACVDCHALKTRSLASYLDVSFVRQMMAGTMGPEARIIVAKALETISDWHTEHPEPSNV